MFDDLTEDDDVYEGEADAQTPSLLPPRENTDLFGHKQHEAYMLDLIEKGKMPHALILAGPKGIGKATFGYRLARYLLAMGKMDNTQDGLFGDALAQKKPESLFIPVEDPVFRKVASGGHPDFLALERPMDDRKGQRKDVLDVDTVRKVVPFLRMTSSNGGWRVVLIDDADTMNRNAQNAILKILEEPPAQTILLMIAHRPGAFIPTIRSRCRVLTFDPLNENDALLELRRFFPSESEASLKAACKMAEGSIGQAITILEEGVQEGLSLVIRVLESWENWPWSEIHRVADSVGRPGQDKAYKQFVFAFQWIMEQLVLAKARGDLFLSDPLDHKGLQNMMGYYSLQALSETYEKIKNHFEQFDRANLDKRQAVLGVFTHFS